MVLNSSPLEIWNIELCGATQLVTATLWPFICLVRKLHQGARGGKIPGIFKKTMLNAICLVIINSIWIYKNVECQCRHAKVFNHPRSWQSVQHILRNPANVVLIKIHCWIPPNWCDRASANHLCFLVCAFSYETCGEFELSSSLQHNYSLAVTDLFELTTAVSQGHDAWRFDAFARSGAGMGAMCTTCSPIFFPAINWWVSWLGCQSDVNCFQLELWPWSSCARLI